MLKKIILVMAGLVILTGMDVLYAQEETDRPQPRPRRRQALEGRQGRRSDIEGPSREQAGRDIETQGLNADIRKLRQELREIKRQLEAIKQEVNIKVNAPKRRLRQSTVLGTPYGGRLTAERLKIEKKEKVREGMPGDRVGRLQQSRRGLNLPMLQGGQWLDDLTKAYRENDRLKMGQLIWRMHQQRQQWREAQPPFGILPGGMGRWGRERDGRDEQEPQRRRMNRRGQNRGTWNEEAPSPGRMGRRFQRRELVDEQGLRTGRMGRRGRGIPEQSDPEPIEEDQLSEIE